MERIDCLELEVKFREKVSDVYSEVGIIVGLKVPVILARNIDGRYILLNKHGERLGTNSFDEVKSSCIENLISVSNNDKWGCVNTLGEIVVPIEADEEILFKESLGLKIIGNKKVFINKKNHTVVDCSKYDVVNNFHCGRARVKKNGLYGYIDKLGREVIKCQYLEATSFDVGVASVTYKKGKSFSITTNGHKVKETIDFKAGYGLRIKKNNRYEIIDRHHQNIFNRTFKEAKIVSENLFAILTKKGWIVVDRNFKKVSEEVFTDIGELSDGLIVAHQNDLCGYYDEQFNNVIPCQYRVGFNFENGYAAISLPNTYLYGIIDKNNNQVLPCNYNYAEYINGIFYCAKGNRIDLFDQNLHPIKTTVTRTMYCQNIDELPKDIISVELKKYCSCFITGNTSIFINANSREEYQQQIFQVKEEIENSELSDFYSYITQKTMKKELKK